MSWKSSEKNWDYFINELWNDFLFYIETVFTHNSLMFITALWLIVFCRDRFLPSLKLHVSLYLDMLADCDPESKG